MDWRFFPVEELPPLAWCASHRSGETVVRVTHGPGVEIRSGAFVEGAWDGPFEEMDFESGFLAGSGGKEGRDGVAVFVCPSHTFERLVTYHRGALTLVSNSLAFALAEATDELDPGFPHYRNYFMSALRNPATGVRAVPTRAGAELRSYYREKVLLGRTGVQGVIQPGEAAPFESFDQYREFLIERTSRLFANAADPARHTRYSPLASVSSGYDSGACAAISREAGCKQAITLRRIQPNGELMDHGGPTAAALGLDLLEGNRDAYYRREDCPEALFLAAGYGAEDVTLAGLQPHLPGRILVTGLHGDQVWSLDRSRVRKGICRPDSAGASLVELRLRTNFIHFPLALLGATAARSIWQISRSEQMKPWSVGGSYDRPIARRILEDAGVQRGTFASKKRGYIAKLDPKKRERPYSHASVLPLSPRSQGEFEDYWKANRNIGHVLAEFKAKPLRGLERRFRAREGQAGVMQALIRGSTRLFFRAPPWYVLNVRYGRPSLLPLWGLQKTISAYRDILRRADTLAPTET